MTFIRHHQRPVTSVVPHPDNLKYAIPSRQLRISRPQMALHINMWEDTAVRMPCCREEFEKNGFSGIRFPEGTISNYYQASVGNGFWGYDPIGDVTAAHQSRIAAHNATISGGLTYTPEDLQAFLHGGDVVAYSLNIIDDKQAQAAVAARWKKPIAMVEMGNELYVTDTFPVIVPDYAAYKAHAQGAQARWNAVLPGSVWGGTVTKDTYDKSGSQVRKDWDLAVEADNGWFDKYIIHPYTQPDNDIYPTPEGQYQFAIDFFDTNWPDVPARWNNKGIWITEWGMLIKNGTGNIELDAFYKSGYAEYWAANVLMTFLTEPLIEFAAVHSWEVFVRSPNTPLYTAYQKLANIPGPVTTIVNNASEHIITIGTRTATLKKQSPYSFTVTPT